jgi:hypothetical protein
VFERWGRALSAQWCGETLRRSAISGAIGSNERPCVLPIRQVKDLMARGAEGGILQLDTSTENLRDCLGRIRDDPRHTHLNETLQFIFVVECPCD